MEWYNYYEAMREAVRERLLREEDLRELAKAGGANDLYDILVSKPEIVGAKALSSWDKDSARRDAEENLRHNWDLYKEACAAFDVDRDDYISQGAIACDGLVREYVLAEVIGDIVDEFKEGGENDD